MKTVPVTTTSTENIRPDFGRAGEADEAHGGMLAQHLADGRRIAGEDIEHALRHAGLFGERDQRQRGQRRFIGGLEHHRAAGGERRRDLSGDHRAREIPRRDRAADTDRLLDRQQPRIRPLGRDGFAIDAAGFFREKFDIGAADIDLAERFRQRLALLRRQDQREVFAVGDDHVEPFAEDVGALLGGEFCPGRERALGGLYGLRRFRGAELRHFRQFDAIDRIGDGIGWRADPGAIDIATVPQQRGVLQAVVQGGLGGLCASGDGRVHGVTPREFLEVPRSIGRYHRRCIGCQRSPGSS
jgi:ParB family chromosome partitioning protein